MKIHVIEDDKMFNRFIEHTLRFDPAVEVVPFFNGADFLVRLSDNPDVVTLDLGLPDYCGEEILKLIKAFNPEIEVIVISGQDDVKTAVQLLKQGAFDYITKDENIRDRLQNCIRHVLNKRALKQEISALKSEISRNQDYQKAIVGESVAMREIFMLIDKAVRVPNIHVSVFGEAGTGKELIARTIHQNSPRKDKPFVQFNVSATPKELVEGELFGYDGKGYTGSLLSRRGKLEEAGEGTLFIEEIDNLDVDLQVKLFRVLEDGVIVKGNGNRPTPVNARIISASNRDLSDAVKERVFREDLYFRLKGIPIYLPLLRERQKDILLLADHFLNAFCLENQMGALKITPRAKRKLMNYAYPGNVRELKAVIELAAVLTNSGEVDEEHIIFSSGNGHVELFTEELTLKDYNEKIIRHYLDKYKSVVKVAEVLDIGKSTIYNLLKSDKVKLGENIT
ncbi:sigma-54-dependent transcriptional regulator [Alkaliflexus imshenetskii]|uniref:sigma-54-dependent transcriptional regulator n=1 Tax=Alkaliflexus imshenetskii TaxID=286730 RepID=UPI0004794A01|nr:sigma-54 dependent transcriptional regulator [Alkaliflexus imshenetskii]